MSSATLPLVPTSAISALLKNLYLAENPCMRLGTCHVMVLRYRQCCSRAFQTVRKFLGCSNTMIEKSGFCTLATFAIQRSEKFSGSDSVPRYTRFFFAPNPRVTPSFCFVFQIGRASCRER